ncbi:Centromere protein S [Allomyces javanicus]|nr:Centromere protein S [Allomyces javanicus]
MDSDSGDDFAAAPPPPAATSFTTAAKLGRTKSSNKRASAAVPVGLDASDVRDNADDDLDAAEAAADAKKAALRTAVHYAVGQICKAEEPNLDVRVPPAAMAAIAQVVHAQLELWGRDLEAFVKHRNKVTVSADDVKLLARRNPALLTHLSEYLDERQADKQFDAATTAAAVGASGGASSSKSGKPSKGKGRAGSGSKPPPRKRARGAMVLDEDDDDMGFGGGGAGFAGDEEENYPFDD